MFSRIAVSILLLGACASSHRNGTFDDAPAAGDAATDGTPSDGDLDAPVTNPDGNTIGMACNPKAPACSTGEKCAWYHDDNANPPAGHSACAPIMAQAVAVGGACSYGQPGAMGYDNCVAGSVCNGGVCEVICDHLGGTPACGANFGCVAVEGLFAPAGSATAPDTGTCEPTCDPIADNDFDGAGTASVKTGTRCGTDPLMGCYGSVSKTNLATFFTCAYPANSGSQHTGGTATYLHRNPVAGLALNEQYLNTCHPGYAMAFATDSTVGTKVLCYAFCKPGNAYQGNPGAQEPSGKAGHQCKTGSSGRGGAFGTEATGSTNGEHCMYSWNFEIDANDVFHRSPTSDTLGICWDHTKYTYGSPATVYPPCATSSIANAKAMACIDTATAGLPATGKPVVHRAFKPPFVIPELSMSRD